jgi:hypothetical protein
MKYPWIQFFAGDWLNDPQVSICDPATRGILMDWLCNMHLLDRCGQITGRREQLARLGRCTSVQVEAALQDLIQSQAADVTFRNDVVTVVNRRMKREYLTRKNGAIRVAKHRVNVACNAPITVHKSEVRVIREERESAPPQFAEHPTWEEWWKYCQSPQCSLMAEFYAKDKFLAAEADNWKGKANWQAYARRCQAWWRADGAPKQQQQRNNQPEQHKPMSKMTSAEMLSEAMR